MKSTVVGLGGPAYQAISDDGSVAIADSDLLLSGTYSRDGDDLVLTGADGQQLQVVEYFSQGTPPALISSDGKMLSGDTVSLLAGPQAPGQYAQADDGQFGSAIGQVETLSGSASAQRPNGLTVELEVGSPVFQGDVVSAGSNSTLGITFIDKTVFTIDNGATIVLNEMVYSPSSSSNSMLFNLLGGTAAFVAGAVAKTGDMKVETPVAVMAIRGTWPFVSCDLAQASCYFGGESGVYDLLHKLRGNVIATVNDPSKVITLTGIDGAPAISDPTDAQKAAMGTLFQSLHDATDSLEQREEDGEDPVRESKGGSTNFAESGSLENISGASAVSQGMVASNAERLLNPTSLLQSVSARESDVIPLEELSEEPPPIGATLTDEDTRTNVDVFSGDDALGATPRIISAFITSGLGAVSISDDGKSIIYDPGTAYN
ncbi:MAG: FecR family protein, partial [Aestuariivirgaceae bacterium]